MNQDTTPRSPAERLAGQARLAGTLTYLGTFRHRPRPVAGCDDDDLPISAEAVAAWVAEHAFTRSTLAPHVARSLAFLDSFRRRAKP